MTAITRRDVLRRGGLAALALLVPSEVLAGCSNGTGGPAAGAARHHGAGTTAGPYQWRVFTSHEAAVVEAATARLIPGPEDDPAEKGHPGAREAGVVYFIDTMLGALDASPAKIFAGGPFSNRKGWHTDDMATFIGLSPAEAHGWKTRLAADRAAYRTGVPALDQLAGGDFAGASGGVQDTALAKNPGGFMALMFAHAIDGMYSNPEYGGNHGLVGWKDIEFPGDVQPRGYTAAEVTNSDGPDKYVLGGIGAKVLTLIDVSNGK